MAVALHRTFYFVEAASEHRICTLVVIDADRAVLPSYVITPDRNLSKIISSARYHPESTIQMFFNNGWIIRVFTTSFLYLVLI